LGVYRAAAGLTRYAAAAVLLAVALHGTASARPHGHSRHAAPGVRHTSAGPYRHARHLAPGFRAPFRHAPSASARRFGRHAALRRHLSRFGPGYGFAAPGLWYGAAYGGVDPGVNPYEGYLAGAADMTRANAEYYEMIEEARYAREKANQEAVRTRQMQQQQVEDEQDRWQRRHDPDAVRWQHKERALCRSRSGPPLTEIWSGEALNALLEDIQDIQSDGVPPPEVSLDQATLARINLTDGSTYLGAGLLKEGTQRHWPLALRQDIFQKERLQIEDMVRKAVTAVKERDVDPKLLSRLDDAIAAMAETAEFAAPDLGSAQYAQAKRYLDDLKGALKVLQHPNAPNYFNHQWRARGNTVGDLVRLMTEKGLKFAPAARGDEAAYVALHRALLTHDHRLQSADR
jgi:hypothetical protein